MKVRIEFEDGDDVSYHDRISFSSNAASDTSDAMLKFVKCFNTRQPETKAEIIVEINDEAKADTDDPDEES